MWWVGCLPPSARLGQCKEYALLHPSLGLCRDPDFFSTETWGKAFFTCNLGVHERFLSDGSTIVALQDLRTLLNSGSSETQHGELECQKSESWGF